MCLPRLDAGAEPVRELFGLPEFDGPGTGEVVFRYDLESTMHAALENALDVPHTAFLHRGMFRGGEPREITAVRREVDGGVEVQYLGEPVGFGRFRGSKEGAKTFDHWDRFLLPCVAQIEYAADGWLLRQAEKSDPGGRARSAGGNGDGDVEADQPVTFRV